MRHAWLAATALSVFGLAVTAGWIAVILSTRHGRHVWQIDRHHHSLDLSGGQTISADSGYALVTNNAGVQLWYTDVTPIWTGPGPDGKPTAGLFDPSVDLIAGIRLRWIIASAVAFGVLPIVWTVGRTRRRVTRGFAVVPL